SLVDMAVLRGGDAARNADIIRSVLDGHSTPAQREIVHLNAAFGIHASGMTSTLAEASALAGESIGSGSGRKKLNDFVKATQEA
ncbi:MAG: anthranilate phosphoribosyltransferase, partial [Balneolaceae bacterium]